MAQHTRCSECFNFEQFCSCPSTEDPEISRRLNQLFGGLPEGEPVVVFIGAVELPLLAEAERIVNSPPTSPIPVDFNLVVEEAERICREAAPPT
jgi:hypothetical protein